MGELKLAQMEIKVWYKEEAEKIVLQAKADDVSTSEKVWIYHHELLKKKI